MGNPKTFSFTLKNDIAELKILCQQLESIGSALGLPQRFVFEINLALDELFTNIISYGFNDSSEHAIQVRIAAEDSMLTITVEDDGIPFNPIERAEPRIARHHRGLHDRRPGDLPDQEPHGRCRLPPQP